MNLPRPRGKDPDQGRIRMEGNEHLTKAFPRLGSVKKAEIAEYCRLLQSGTQPAYGAR